LLEVNRGNFPVDSITDYTVVGNFICSKFNNYCFFDIVRFTINTELELVGDSLKQIPFEYQFKKELGTTFVGKTDGRYYCDFQKENKVGSRYDFFKIDLTDFIKNNPQKIKDENYGGVFIEGAIYVKGFTNCKVIKSNNSINEKVIKSDHTINEVKCIIMPDVVELK